MTITALILTYNEEGIIAECLDAITFVDKIVVLDSGSTDNTSKIAQEFGAEVVYRKFDNYSSQRNFGLGLIKSGWILMIDADEIVTKTLSTEITMLVERDPKEDMFLVRRKDYFKGRWLRYAGFYPTWIPRLFKAGTVKVDRAVNEQYVSINGEGKLIEHLNHYPFNKGTQFWYEKHIRYAFMESNVLQQDSSLGISLLSDLISSSFLKRRSAIKKLSFLLPFRLPLIWFYLVFIQRGFLDGREGMQFISMRLDYERLIKRFINEGKM